VFTFVVADREGRELGRAEMPSLRKMLVRWVVTVRREMNMRSAICGLDNPSATAAATVSSVGVRLCQPSAGRDRRPRPRLT
jgi:hypothetical protein